MITDLYKITSRAHFINNILSSFKKSAAIILLVLGFTLTGFSQSVTNYTFAASSGAFTALSNPSFPGNGGGNGTDEAYGIQIPIGFDFWYLGTSYSTISASSNGWIKFGADINTTVPVNDLAAGTLRPIVAPLWDDLDVVAVGNISYLTTGTAGSRIFTIQYLGIKWSKAATAASISFQVKLYEGSGKIQFIYRRESGVVAGGSASVGITGTATGSGNFLSLNNLSNTATVSSTTETKTISAWPVSGQTYTFTPPVPAAPGSLTFSGVYSTSMTLSWSNVSNETGFLIYRSIDNTNYSLVSQTAVNVITSVQTGLTAGTTYYWRIYAISEGAVSAALSGTKATPGCTPALSGTSQPTCVGGSTGTITLTATGGAGPSSYMYRLNGGTYQAATTFSGLAAGAYTMDVSSGECVATTSVTVAQYGLSTESKDTAATDSWIGHMFDGSNFENYLGRFTETENFNETFGGSGTCFNFNSPSNPKSIFTESFSVKFRMASTKKGLYTADLGSDDGSRLSVDGTKLYDFWNSWSNTNNLSVLMNLNGASSLLYEYHEDGGENRVVFQNLRQLIVNKLTGNITQSICTGTSGAAISGDKYADYGELLAGISLSGIEGGGTTGYQWYYSTTAAPTSRIVISGATGATFIPAANTAPFNVPGTYNIYRNAILKSVNNILPNPYIATNESNMATITVSATVGTPTAITKSAQPACQLTNGTTTTTYSTTAANNSGFNWSVTNTLAGSINAATGVMTWANGFTGSVNIQVTANGCGGPSAQISQAVTITPSAGTPSAITISAGTQPTCQLTNGTTTTTYSTTATNSSAFAWSVNNTSAGTINASTGVMTWANGFSGTVNVQVTATGCNGPSAQTIKTITIAAIISNNKVDFTNGVHGTICITDGEYGSHYFNAPAGTVFSNIGFASYGLPTGTCATGFNIGSAHVASSQQKMEVLLLGKNADSIVVAGNTFFGEDPISGTVKLLYVQATYTQPVCSGTSPGTLTGTAPSGGNGAFTYLWEKSTTSSSTGFTTASGTSTAQSYTPGILTQTTWYRRTVSSGGCSSTSTVLQVTVVVSGTWLGAVSNDWSLAANWSCGALPDSTTNLSLPIGLSRYPVINAGNTGSLQNINLAIGASIVVSGKLKIAGSVSNFGILNVTGGTVEMNGPSSQTISNGTFTGNTIKNLVINNKSAVILSGSLDVTNELTLTQGLLNIVPNGYLTLKSTAAGTARVAPVTGGSISGKVTVERWLSNKRAWRLLTAPLSNTGTIFNSWQNGGIYQPGKGMFVTGPGPLIGNGLDISAQNAISMKSYGITTQNWVNITDPLHTDLSPGKNASAANIGYFVFIRGDRSVTNLISPNFNSTTLASTGNLQIGTQTFPTAAAFNGFTILGNPYASPVDFNKLTRVHVAKRFYVWDASINTLGAYVTVDDTNGDGTYSVSNPSSSQTQHIQSGQAFFVQTDTIGAGSITYNENSKSSLSTNAMFRPAGQAVSVAFLLNLREPGNTLMKADGALVEFDENFYAGVNLQDAVKFGNVNENLSLLRDGNSLSIERRPLIKSNDTLFLKLATTTQRDYQFVIMPVNLSQPNLHAFLEDKYTGIATPVGLDSNTIFNFTINSEAASRATDRFRLVFKQGIVLPVTYRDVKAFRQGTNIAVQWEVENQVNIRSYEVEKSTNGIAFTKVNTQSPVGANGTAATYTWLDTHSVTGDNFYRIRNIDLDGATSYSKVVKVNTGNAAGAGEITVYPNPVTGGKINLQLSNMPKGKYIVRLLSPIGQELLTKEINHLGGAATESVLISGHISKGMYPLEIIHPDKSKNTITVMNQ